MKKRLFRLIDGEEKPYRERRVKIREDELRGENAELRFISLANDLAQGIPWIGKVRRAGTKFDRHGIDLVIFIRSESGARIKVPYQIKSSNNGLVKYQRLHADCVSAEVPCIVVNNHYTDAEIQLRLLAELLQIRSKGKTFEALFEDALKERDEMPLHRLRNANGRRIKQALRQGVVEKTYR